MKNRTPFVMVSRKKAPLSATFSLVAVALLMASPTPALAYIDPGAGSMLVQIILGGTAGLLLLGRLIWVSIKGWATRPFTKNRQQQPDSATHPHTTTMSSTSEPNTDGSNSSASKDPQHAL